MLVCAVLTFPVYRDFLRHDYMLYQAGRVLRQIKHPPGTSPVAFKKSFGVLFGNGNHCDFFIGELRRYSGGQPPIASFYSDITGKNVSLLFIENGEFPESHLEGFIPYSLDHLSAWLNSPDVPRDHLYLLYSSGFIDMNPGWDFRCS